MHLIARSRFQVGHCSGAHRAARYGKRRLAASVQVNVVTSHSAGRKLPGKRNVVDACRYAGDFRHGGSACCRLTLVGANVYAARHPYAAGKVGHRRKANARSVAHIFGYAARGGSPACVSVQETFVVNLYVAFALIRVVGVYNVVFKYRRSSLVNVNIIHLVRFSIVPEDGVVHRLGALHHVHSGALLLCRVGGYGEVAQAGVGAGRGGIESVTAKGHAAAV